MVVIFFLIRRLKLFFCFLNSFLVEIIDYEYYRKDKIN